MKKYFGAVFLSLMSISLVACGTDKKNSENHSLNYEENSENEVQIVNRDKERKIYELEHNGKKSVVELTVSDDSLLNEKATIEGTFEALGKSDREKVEETLEEMKKSQEERKGVNVSYEIYENKASMTTKTNYELVDLEELGMTKETLDEAGEFPSAKVRIKEYETMGYKEK